MADGSTLELKKVAFAAGYQYEHKSGPKWVMPLTPLIPDRLEGRFFGMSHGSFGFGGPGTNLILITEWHAATSLSQPPRRVRISDDRGNVFDAKEGAHTLGMMNLTVNGWEVSAFPRRSKTLTAEFIGLDQHDRWVSFGTFTLDNPVGGGDFPQWTPEPLPQSRTNRGLTFRLEQFASGCTALGSGDGPLAAHATRIMGTFLEADQAVRNHGVHRLTVSDATGNRVQPYFDANVIRGGTWTRGGFIEFAGALWPGESAWKLEIESIQLADHDATEVWDLHSLALPAAAGRLAPTNTFHVGEFQVKLQYLLAPSVTVTNDWQWVLRYWGNEANVHVLGLEFPDGRQRREPVLVEARDEAGQPAKLVDNRAWDDRRHALFVAVPPGMKSLHVKLAFPELRKFEFLARPEQVGQPPAVAP